MTVYLLQDHIQYEGSAPLAIYLNEEDATADMKQRAADPDAIGVSFRVSEWDVLESYTPPTSAPVPTDA
jgi:hypothetical protein